MAPYFLLSLAIGAACIGLMLLAPPIVVIPVIGLSLSVILGMSLSFGSLIAISAIAIAGAKSGFQGLLAFPRVIDYGFRNLAQGMNEYFKISNSQKNELSTEEKDLPHSFQKILENLPVKKEKKAEPREAAPQQTSRAEGHQKLIEAEEEWPSIRLN